MKAIHYILIAIILALAILGVGYMNYQVKNREFQQKQLEVAYREQQLTACEQDAWDNYHQEWAGSCRIFYGLTSCDLPAYRANEHEDSRNKRIEICIKRYAD